MIHTANEFTAKHNRHILFQVAAGLKALPPPGPGRPDSSSQIASDTASAATHMDKAGFLTTISNHAQIVSENPSACTHIHKAGYVTSIIMHPWKLVTLSVQVHTRPSQAYFSSR